MILCLKSNLLWPYLQQYMVQSLWRCSSLLLQTAGVLTSTVGNKVAIQKYLTEPHLQTKTIHLIMHTPYQHKMITKTCPCLVAAKHTRVWRMSVPVCFLLRQMCNVFVLIMCMHNLFLFIKLCSNHMRTWVTRCWLTCGLDSSKWTGVYTTHYIPIRNTWTSTIPFLLSAATRVLALCVYKALCHLMHYSTDRTCLVGHVSSPICGWMHLDSRVTLSDCVGSPWNLLMFITFTLI